MTRTGYRNPKRLQGRRKTLQKQSLFWRLVDPIIFLQLIGRITYKTLFIGLKLAWLILCICLKLKSPLKTFLLKLKCLLRKNYYLGRVYQRRFWQITERQFNQLKSNFNLFKIRFSIFNSFIFSKIFKNKLPKIRRRYLWLVGILGTVFFLISFCLYFFIIKDLPSPNRLITRDQILATKIYDRKGRLLYTIFDGNQKRTLITLDDIPQHMIQATIAIEDQDFWQHPGFSLRGITRAVKRNVARETLQGGSTITQQLVKNALLTSERTLIRKIKEIILAIQVELLFSKTEILEMYFNEIPYGGTAYGIEEAAQTYFGKPVQDINLAEAALLAGLPVAPTKFSPFGANPQLAYVRQHQVLQRMQEEGYISSEEAAQARKTKLNFKPPVENIQAPHFVMYIKDLLVEKYGTKRVEQGGLEVITSLDLELQQLAEQELRQEINKLNQFHITNGAILITNPATGGILAMVGSKDYFDIANDGNVNVTTSLRQPGSAIKPINYALAFQSGLTPSSIIQDEPTTYHISGSPPYTPVNYDHRFHGSISLRTALASSYNVPAVKLLSINGVNQMIDLAEKMGITTWQDRLRFGLSLTLGGGEIKMTDMAVVYGVLANQGLRVDLHPILELRDYQGKVLERFCDSQFNLLPLVEAAEGKGYCDPQPVLNPMIAYQLTDILSDNQARAPAFGLNSSLNIPDHQVAVKTGTTNDKRDNWTIGYTQDYVVAVWVGNNNNSPMSAVASGVTGASPIWHNIMTQLLADLSSPHLFSLPLGLKAIPVCSLNGLLPCEGCPTKTEYFIPGTEPTVHCNFEQEDPQREQNIIFTETTNP